MLNSVGDWTFGNGLGNYLTDQNAIALDVQTRLYSFLGDCFFDAESGIDWFNLLGSKNEAALLFSIKATILNTNGITSVTELNAALDTNRNLTVSYAATSLFGASVAGVLTIPVTPYSGISKFLQDIIFTGQTSIDVDVSSTIRDARIAVWILYDVANGYAPVVGAVQPISISVVRLTISPAPSGTFRLLGIS